MPREWVDVEELRKHHWQKEEGSRRYTAEHRGGDWDDKPWEWCVIDEEDGLFGSAILFDLTEEDAKAKAKEMNKNECS